MKFKFKKLTKDTLASVFVHIFLAAGIFVVLAVLYFYWFLPKTTNHGETITVPDIQGMALTQLESELKKRTLRYEADSSYSQDYPPLTVLRQYPEAGSKVKEGRVIFVTINRINPPSALVPDLVDGSVVNADAVLRSNQLKRGHIELVPGPFNVVKEMKYKGMKIAAGAPVPKGSVIDLVVMDGGSNEFSAPNLLGYSFEDAKFTILGSNLNMGKVTLLLADTTGKNAVVVKQKPAEGENIKVGDAVDLWIGLSGTTVNDDDSGDDDDDENFDNE